MFNFLIIAGVLIFGYCLFILWQSWPRKRSVIFSAKSRPSINKKTNAPKDLEKQLLRMLNGDRRTMSRLINAAKLKTPQKPERWYWEKVIYDLARDRRS